MPSQEMQLFNSNHLVPGARTSCSAMDLSGALQAIRAERQELGLPPYSSDEELQSAQRALVACRASIECALTNESMTVTGELDKAAGYFDNISQDSWGGPMAFVAAGLALIAAIAFGSFIPLAAGGLLSGVGVAVSRRTGRNWRRCCGLYRVRQGVSNHVLLEARNRAIADMTTEVRRILHGLPVDASPEQIANVHRMWYWEALPKDAGIEERTAVIEELNQAFNIALKARIRFLEISALPAEVFESQYAAAVQDVYKAYHDRISAEWTAHQIRVAVFAAERDAEIKRINSGLQQLEGSASGPPQITHSS